MNKNAFSSEYKQNSESLTHENNINSIRNHYGPLSVTEKQQIIHNETEDFIFYRHACQNSKPIKNFAKTQI